MKQIVTEENKALIMEYMVLRLLALKQELTDAQKKRGREIEKTLSKTAREIVSLGEDELI